MERSTCDIFGHIAARNTYACFCVLTGISTSGRNETLWCLQCKAGAIYLRQYWNDLPTTVLERSTYNSPREIPGAVPGGVLGGVPGAVQEGSSEGPQRGPWGLLGVPGTVPAKIPWEIPGAVSGGVPPLGGRPGRTPRRIRRDRKRPTGGPGRAHATVY